MDDLFPESEPLGLEDLVKRLRRAPRMLRIPGRLVQRVVAYRFQDTWLPFANLVTLGDLDAPRGPMMIRAKGAVLLRLETPVTRLRTVNRFLSFLQQWRRTLKVEPISFEVQDNANSYWQPSGSNGYAQPYWNVSVFEKRPEASSQFPSGPFSNTKEGIYATSLWDLAADWMGDDSLRRQMSARREIDVRVFESRAFIRSLTHSGDRVIVDVASSGRQPTVCIGTVSPSTKESGPQRVPVRKHRAELSVPAEGAYFLIDLLGTNDVRYDRRSIVLEPALNRHGLVALDENGDSGWPAAEPAAPAHDIPDQALSLLHEQVRTKCRALIRPDTYGEAVEKSFKLVRARLRLLTGKERATDAFGTGRLRIGGAAAPYVEEDFNEGAKFLMMAIDRFRNEKSHTADAGMDDADRAYLYLALSSLALRLLDQAVVSTNPTSSPEEPPTAKSAPKPLLGLIEGKPPRRAR
ncbi:MAG: TIGR02391 family protein [Fimbriimonadales bacterium]